MLYSFLEVIGRWLAPHFRGDWEVIGGDWPGSPPQRNLQFACVLQHFHISAIPRNCREQIPFMKLKGERKNPVRVWSDVISVLPFLEFYQAPLTSLLRIYQGVPYVLFILCLNYVCVAVSFIFSIAGIFLKKKAPAVRCRHATKIFLSQSSMESS